MNDAGENVEVATETSELSQKDKDFNTKKKAFLNRLEKKKQQLSYVTEETLSQFQLTDVEMIVPGHGIAYPKVCCQQVQNLRSPSVAFYTYSLI